MTDDDVARMRKVDAGRLLKRAHLENGDKRTRTGRRRYVRKHGDHSLLLPACSCSGTIARGCARPGETCSFCDGAVLTSAEKHDAVPPG